MKISSGIIVYVNVACGIYVYVNVTSFAWGGELFMWMLHHCFSCLTHENIKWNNCLCECYIVCVNVTLFALGGELFM
jgi:hypothetical protein